MPDPNTIGGVNFEITASGAPQAQAAIKETQKAAEQAASAVTNAASGAGGGGDDPLKKLASEMQGKFDEARKSLDGLDRVLEGIKEGTNAGAKGTNEMRRGAEGVDAAFGGVTRTVGQLTAGIGVLIAAIKSSEVLTEALKERLQSAADVKLGEDIALQSVDATKRLAAARAEVEKLDKAYKNLTESGNAFTMGIEALRSGGPDSVGERLGNAIKRLEELQNESNKNVADRKAEENERAEKEETQKTYQRTRQLLRQTMTDRERAYDEYAQHIEEIDARLAKAKDEKLRRAIIAEGRAADAAYAATVKRIDDEERKKKEAEDERNARAERTYRETIAANEKVASRIEEAFKGAIDRVGSAAVNLFPAEQLTTSVGQITAKLDTIASQLRAVGRRDE